MKPETKKDDSKVNNQNTNIKQQHKDEEKKVDCFSELLKYKNPTSISSINKKTTNVRAISAKDKREYTTTMKQRRQNTFGNVDISLIPYISKETSFKDITSSTTTRKYISTNLDLLWLARYIPPTISRTELQSFVLHLFENIIIPFSDSFCRQNLLEKLASQSTELSPTSSLDLDKNNESIEECLEEKGNKIKLYILMPTKTSSHLYRLIPLCISKIKRLVNENNELQNIIINIYEINNPIELLSLPNVSSIVKNSIALATFNNNELRINCGRRISKLVYDELISRLPCNKIEAIRILSTYSHYISLGKDRKVARIGCCNLDSYAKLLIRRVSITNDKNGSSIYKEFPTEVLLAALWKCSNEFSKFEKGKESSELHKALILLMDSQIIPSYVSDSFSPSKTSPYTNTPSTLPPVTRHNTLNISSSSPKHKATRETPNRATGIGRRIE